MKQLINNIKELIVSFEVAKLLKEKGFKVNSNYFYTKPNTKMFGIDEHGRLYNIKNSSKKLYSTGDYCSTKDEYVYLAPTIQMAVEWIFQNFNIWITVLPNYNHKLFTAFLKTEKSTQNLVENFKYSSPQEAYNAVLEYCLTNLID